MTFVIIGVDKGIFRLFARMKVDLTMSAKIVSNGSTDENCDEREMQ